jgi:hypothetical protein
MPQIPVYRHDLIRIANALSYSIDSAPTASEAAAREKLFSRICSELAIYDGDDTYKDEVRCPKD